MIQLNSQNINIITSFFKNSKFKLKQNWSFMFNFLKALLNAEVPPRAWAFPVLTLLKC